MPRAVSLKTILEASDDTVIDLLERDDSTWASLLAALVENQLETSAPSAFVEALIDHEPDLSVWIKLATNAAFENEQFEFASNVKGAFLDWFIAGVHESPSVGDPSRIEATLLLLEYARVADLVGRGREFVVQLGARTDLQELRYRATLVHASRCLEQGFWDEALAIAEEGLTIDAAPFTTRGPALRLVAAACFGRRDLARALSTLDEVASVDDEAGDSSAGGLPVKHQSEGLDPFDTLLRRLAVCVQVRETNIELCDDLEPVAAALKSAGDQKGAELIEAWISDKRSAHASFARRQELAGK